MIGQRDILIKIVELLEEYGISYLLTGSFAVSYYGFPRATHDIDFVIEIHRAEKKGDLKLKRRILMRFWMKGRVMEFLKNFLVKENRLK